jgi:hypothetical protein
MASDECSVFPHSLWALGRTLWIGPPSLHCAAPVVVGGAGHGRGSGRVCGAEDIAPAIEGAAHSEDGGQTAERLEHFRASHYYFLFFYL